MGIFLSTNPGNQRQIRIQDSCGPGTVTKTDTDLGFRVWSYLRGQISPLGPSSSCQTLLTLPVCHRRPPRPFGSHGVYYRPIVDLLLDNIGLRHPSGPRPLAAGSLNVGKAQVRPLMRTDSSRIIGLESTLNSRPDMYLAADSYQRLGLREYLPQLLTSPHPWKHWSPAELLVAVRIKRWSLPLLAYGVKRPQ